MIKKVLILILISIVILLTSCNNPNSPSYQNSTKEPRKTPNYESATEDYIAIIGGERVYKSDLRYFLNETVAQFDAFDPDLEPEEAAEYIKEYLETKDESGVSNLTKLVDEAYRLSCIFKVSYLEGVKGGYDLSKREKDDIRKDFLNQVSSLYKMMKKQLKNIAGLDIDTVDDMFRLLVGMNLNDYIRYSIQESCVSEYNMGELEKIVPTEEQILAYYNENKDSYITASIRNVEFNLYNDEGILSEKNKKAKYNKALELKNKIEAGTYELDALIKEYSENEYDETCIMDVSKDYWVSEIVEWAFKHTEITGKSELIETESGYSVVLFEGYMELDNESVKYCVESGYKDKVFSERIEQLLAEYEVKEVNRDLMEQTANEFLEYVIKLT